MVVLIYSITLNIFIPETSDHVSRALFSLFLHVWMSSQVWR